MAIDAGSFKSQLVALLPPGRCFSVAPGGVMDSLLSAFSKEFARFDARVDDLIMESDPRLTTELLADWERNFGLPGACSGLAETELERRQNLTRKVAVNGGQTTEFYVAVGAALGYVITVEDGIPYEAGHTFQGQEITAEQWVFVWRVTGPGTSVKELLCGQAVCGDALRWWGNALLECVISKLKPAHTHVIYSYF